MTDLHDEPATDATSNAGADEFERLARFLHAAAFPDAEHVRIVDVSRPRGGMSWETFFVRLEIGRPYDEQRAIVIKRAPGDVGPLGPYNAEKDAVVFQALHGHVPVPRFVAHCDDPAVFTRPFSAVELVEGESDDLYRVEKWPTWQQHRTELGIEIAAALAALHRFDWRNSVITRAVTPPPSIGESIARMVAWYVAPYESQRDDVTVPRLFWRDLAVWLVDNAPEIPPDEMVVVHGDFRFGNMIWDGPKLAAIIDWERAMIGDPMSNLGFLAMPMARRRRPELMGMALTFDELDRAYTAASGSPIDRRRFQYYMIFWQFIEGSLQSRPVRRPEHESPGGTDLARRGSAVGTLPIGGNLHLVQTSRLIDAFERGDHDVV